MNNNKTDISFSTASIREAWKILFNRLRQL